MQDLNGPRREDFAASRSRVGVHERTFLQQLSVGDFVIVTLEGEDPGHAFASGSDDFYLIACCVMSALRQDALGRAVTRWRLFPRRTARSAPKDAVRPR